MACTHINNAKTQILLLIDSGWDYKEMGPFLTIEKLKNFMQKRWTNPEEWELDQISEKYPVVDEDKLNQRLKERLNKVNDLLEQCNCLSEVSEQLAKGKKEKDIEVKDKELVLSTTQRENEDLKKENEKLRTEIIQLKKNIASVQKQSTEMNLKEKIGIKEDELGEYVDEKERNKIYCADQVTRLESLYRKLSIKEREKNEEEEEKIREEIIAVKSELSKKGMKFNDVKKISKICEEIASLQFEQKQEAKIEVLLIKN